MSREDDTAITAAARVPRPITGSELKRVMDAERTGTPFLTLRDGAGVLHVIEMPTSKTTLIVGRRAGCDIPLTWDEEVSRVHAEFHMVGDEWTISDDGLSRNGTTLNGSRISSRRRLAHGDTLRFGDTTTLFHWMRDATTDRTVPGREIPTIENLTPTQRKILVALARPYRDGSMIASPATNQQIALEVHLSVDAVKSHLRALAQRFGIGELPKNQKRTAIVEYAFRSGLISQRDL